MFDAIVLSDVLGYTSIACWLGAQFPQVVENIRRQSCEGLALPFLANWLMGDVSNLVGCILTHQLPFQTYLATYFVCVDLMLVVQYFYYAKASPGGPTSVLGHIRSASVPAAVRRMSVERGKGRYRTLSALASNMAAAAAIAAHQDSTSEPYKPRYSHATSRRHRDEESSNGGSVVRRDLSPQGISGDEEEEFPAMMVDSFRSEGGRDIGRKRVSWSIERRDGRAASVGRGRLPTTPTGHNHPLDQSLISAPDGSIRQQEPSQNDSPLVNSTDSAALPSTRSSRASRRGSSMIFLAVCFLYSFNSFSGHQAGNASTLTHVGRVLGQSSFVGSPSGSRLDLYRRESSHDTTVTAVVHSPPVGEVYFASAKQSHDPTEDPPPEQVLGRIFAWLCTTLYLTSRLPQIWKNYVRKSVEGLSMYLFIFAFLGNTFYVASILTSPRRFLPEPEASQFIRESIPYLLGSAGTLMFDVTIVSQSFIYRPKHRRRHRLYDGDEEAATGLLANNSAAEPLSGVMEPALTNRGRPLQPHDPVDDL